MNFSFEKLQVWIDSKELVKLIYKQTQLFPNEERYGLTSQIRRASISVPSNISEGSTRKSNKDKARFYVIAYGSLIEVLNQLIIAYEINFINKTNYLELRSKIEKISIMLNRLHKATLAKHEP
jgi:four helix bundle protein